MIGNGLNDREEEEILPFLPALDANKRSIAAVMQNALSATGNNNQLMNNFTGKILGGGLSI